MNYYDKAKPCEQGDRKLRIGLRAGKEGEIEMNERTVTFLKVVQRSFFLVLFLILVLSSNSLAGTFKFVPATHQITCYDGSGNVIECPSGGNSMVQSYSYSDDPLTYTDNGNGTVTNTGLMFMFVPAAHRTPYYDGSDDLLTHTDNTALIWQKNNENPYRPHMVK